MLPWFCDDGVQSSRGCLLLHCVKDRNPHLGTVQMTFDVMF